VTVAIAWSPASRAEDQPSAPAATQPAPATSPATASQPAATPQPTADQRLEELEKEVILLQQQIAAMKSDSTPGMKTAAYAVSAPEPAAGGFTPGSTAEDAPAKISIASLLGPITLSGLGDVYYGYANNHPFNNLAGLRSFEAPTNGFNFNLAELILDKAPDATTAESRVGYHIAAGYGYAAKVVNGSDNTGFGDQSNFYLKEAYVSYLAPVGKGLTVTVGKFVTPIGAEVIESNANWNYSRGLLFNYAIPFFHFGASAKYAFNSKWSATGYLVNGWNNTIINHDSGVFGASSGLTYGTNVTFTPNMKWSVIENYFAGPVTGAIGFNGQTLNDWKQLSDTVISYTPNSKWAFMLNGDYGFGPRFYTTNDCGDSVSSRPRPQGGEFCEASPAVDWWGVAGYAKYTFSPKSNFAVRYEYYDDPQGYTGLLATSNPFSETFGRGWAQEVTATYSYNLTSALLLRGEYRYDFASQPIFVQSLSSKAFSDDICDICVKQQNTATISFVYTFSSANTK
jgi:Putative beta-barrel porin-2, OmpL-like. bbp2